MSGERGYDHSQYRNETGNLVRRRRKAMGLTQQKVASMVGVTVRSLWLYEAARASMSVANAANIADALAAPELMEIVRRHREKSCELCGKTFLDTSAHWRRLTCSPRCFKTLKQRKQRLDTSMYRERDLGRLRGKYMVIEQRLRERDAAILAFCNGCEPLGVCRDEECQLREVSPLPFIPMSSATKRAG